MYLTIKSELLCMNFSTNSNENFVLPTPACPVIKRKSDLFKNCSPFVNGLTP